MEIKDLEKECDMCNGNGHDDDGDQCYNCEGIGGVPTYEGQQLLDFIRRYI
jgi:DnaJ-class molecular chaperone